MKTYSCEYTDTFGGEANYSWVRRAVFSAPEDASRAMLMRLAKAALGLSGLRMRVTDTGDSRGIEGRPYRMCTVLFVFEDLEPDWRCKP